jgi:hypothetical protein
VQARVALGHGPSIRSEDILSWLGGDGGLTRSYRLRLLTEPIPTPLR